MEFEFNSIGRRPVRRTTLKPGAGFQAGATSAASARAEYRPLPRLMQSSDLSAVGETQAEAVEPEDRSDPANLKYHRRCAA